MGYFMKVQSIQTTSDCQKPCFKTKFIEDYNGYIHRACNSAKMTKSLKHNMDIFSKKFPKTQLEILNVEKSNITSSYVYDVYNHSTGKIKHIFLHKGIKNKYSLNRLLTKLNTQIKNGDDFFYISILGDFIEG